jgi:hypothetical protein
MINRFIYCTQCNCFARPFRWPHYVHEAYLAMRSSPAESDTELREAEASGELL